jgi:RNA polymerase primary sigma factor
LTAFAFATEDAAILAGVARGRLAEAMALLGDSLAAYYAETQRFPLLDHRQETALAHLIERPVVLKTLRRSLASELEVARFNADLPRAHELAAALAQTEEAIPDAAEQSEWAIEFFTCCNLRLVVAFAQPHRRQADMLDLIQEGNVALMRAVEKYDWRAGVRFSTYGARWVRPAIRAAAREQRGVIHTPVAVARQLRLMREVADQLREADGGSVSDLRLAVALGLDPAKIAELRRIGRSVGSLDEEFIGDDGEATTFAEDLEDREVGSFDAMLAEAETREALLCALTDLRASRRNGPREALVILLRNGIVNTAETTLQDIGRMIGVSRERARQHERDGYQYLGQHPALVTVMAKRQQALEEDSWTTT